MDLEKLIQIAARNSHHFVDDEDQPGGVRSISPVGDLVLAELRITCEEYDLESDAEQNVEAQARLVDAANELQAIAASISAECPDVAEPEPST